MDVYGILIRSLSKKYRDLLRALSKKDSIAHMRMFRELDLIKGELDPTSEEILRETVSTLW